VTPHNLLRLALLGLLLVSGYPMAASAAAAKDLETDSEFDRYLRNAKELRKHRDTGELDEEAVLKTLGAAGVFDDRPGQSWGVKSFAQGFRPFVVRVYKGLWVWPLRAGIVSSEFGRRWGRQHQGLDIAADEGVPVRAAAPGEVIYSGDGLRGYGNVVILRHDNEVTSLYAHNQELLVKAGQKVKIGEVLAKLGSTGHSTGPHVHFEVRRKQKPLNPRKMLPKTRF